MQPMPTIGTWTSNSTGRATTTGFASSLVPSRVRLGRSVMQDTLVASNKSLLAGCRSGEGDPMMTALSRRAFLGGAVVVTIDWGKVGERYAGAKAGRLTI